MSVVSLCDEIVWWVSSDSLGGAVYPPMAARRVLDKLDHPVVSLLSANENKQHCEGLRGLHVLKFLSLAAQLAVYKTMQSQT